MELQPWNFLITASLKVYFVSLNIQKYIQVLQDNFEPYTEVFFFFNLFFFPSQVNLYQNQAEYDT